MDQEQIDALITLRIAQFHQALVERGQIPPPPPTSGVTGGYKADQAAVEDRSQQPSSIACRR